MPVDGRVPWDHIDCGVEWRFLVREYQKSLKDRLSPPCGKPFGSLRHKTNLEDAEKETGKLVCFNCGVACDMTRMRDERIEFLRKLDAHGDGNSIPLAGTEADVQAAVEACEAVGREVKSDGP